MQTAANYHIYMEMEGARMIQKEKIRGVGYFLMALAAGLLPFAAPDACAQALREGNARYEARFGRVFLIRAKGRSGEEMLQALTRRLQHTADEEVAEALAQLREITMLRLEGVIGE